jgi:RimJ/RimL family protein N-acetyltransferase
MPARGWPFTRYSLGVESLAVKSNVTFYNIIFGLLAVGAFREVIFALSRGPNWPLLCLATTLSLLAFSDAIYTAVVVEGKKTRYTIEMKMLDLLSFVLLSFAVVIVNPCSNDMFEVDVTKVLGRVVGATKVGPETLFWGLLTIYMGVLIRWNWIANEEPIERRGPKWPGRVQPLMALMFLTMAMTTVWEAGLGVPLACQCPDPAVDPNAVPCVIPVDGGYIAWLRGAVVVAVAAYLFWFKRLMSKVLDRLVTTAKLTYSDVVEIHSWPRYEGKLSQLDYALRPEGWLNAYPESAENARYGLWQGGELVGFTLLVGIKSKETAEFYIAVRGDRLRHGIGYEATQLTIQRGWRDFRLQSIHLKVRTWHDNAMNVYERAGFTPGKKFKEDIDGAAVEFVRMNVTRPSQWQRLARSF